MPVYKYKAEDPYGTEITGQYEAFTQNEVEIYLKRSNLTPLEIKRSWLRADISFGEQVKIKDLVVFTRMFGALSKAAVPLDQALRVLHEQTDNKKLKQSIQRVIVDVESGASLAESMRNQPSVYPPLYTNMIEAGEVSGNLDTILDRLASMLERNEHIRSKVKGALVYPAIIAVVASLAIAALLMFVVPQFVSVFRDAGVELPIPTKIAIWVSSFLQTQWYFVLAGIVGLILGGKYMQRIPGFEEFWSKFSLKLPILGNVVLKGALARFSRTLATVLASGVSILDGLELTAETADNKVIARVIRDAQTEISRGSEIAPPLRRSEVFPPLVTSMIAIGEESGDLPGMLEKVADFYEEDVEKAVDNALKLIEPVMLVIMGVIVGGIMLAIYLPMFDMIAAVGGVST